MDTLDKVREIVTSKLRSLGIEPTKDNVDEVMRFIKFSSVPVDMLDRAVVDYVKWRWFR